MSDKVPGWWTKTEWTEEHYSEARRLVRSLPDAPSAAWDHEDNIQEAVLKFLEKRQEIKHFESWFRKCLRRRSISEYYKENFFRPHRGKPTKSKQRIEADEVDGIDPLFITTPVEHSQEWEHLIARGVLNEPTLSENELRAVAEHCCGECKACWDLLKKSDYFMLIFWEERWPAWFIKYCRRLSAMDESLLLADFCQEAARAWRQDWPKPGLIVYVLEALARKIRRLQAERKLGLYSAWPAPRLCAPPEPCSKTEEAGAAKHR